MISYRNVFHIMGISFVEGNWILSDDHNHRHDIMEKTSIFLLDKIKKYAIYIYI